MPADSPAADSPAAASPAAASPATPPPRIVGIDAYRGFVMLLMMAEVLHLQQVAKALPESSFWRFLAWHQTHVPWAGCTLHDLIQPSFSFLVGVSLPFSLASRSQAGARWWKLWGRAIWRGVFLAGLGIFLRSMGKTQTNFTFDDTLTQIGLGYLPLFALALLSPRWQWSALAVILVGYWGAFVYYPAAGPDFDYAAVGVPADWPHHYTGFAAHWNKNSNLAWAFDTWWMNLFPRPQPFTHSGGGYATLSFIPTLGTMLLGVIAGQWLRQSAETAQQITRLIVAGAVLFTLGWLLDATGVCPSVKRIWTPAWTLLSGGLCCWMLAAFYGLTDAIGWRWWAWPLQVIGANSLVAYCIAHGSDSFILSSFRTHFGADCFDLFGEVYVPVVAGGVVLATYWLILWWLYRQRILVRV